MSSESLLVISSDSEVREAVRRQAEEIARIEGIPITGLSILGGKPYINVTGLDAKIKNMCKEKGWDFHEMTIQPIEHAVPENGNRAGYRATIKFFDKHGFLEALRTLKGKALSEDLLALLRESFMHSFSDEGWASPESLRMSTLRNSDVINMMASRRASNRAKRAATGTGLTSLDEMNVEIALADEAQLQAQPEPRPARPGHDIADEPLTHASLAALIQDRDAATIEEASKRIIDLAQAISRLQDIDLNRAVIEASRFRDRAGETRFFGYNHVAGGRLESLRWANSTIRKMERWLRRLLIEAEGPREAE